MTDINIGQFVSKRAEMNPNKLMVNDVLAERRFSYAQMNARVNRAAGLLQSLGLENGDRVALLLYNGHEFIEAFFAAAKLGLVIVPLNWRLTPSELGYIIKDSGARALLYDVEFAENAVALKTGSEEASAVDYWIEVRGQANSFANNYDELMASQGEEEPVVNTFGDDNLFIMYTSGTTGLPKGAVHTHNTVFWSIINYSATAGMYYEDNHLVFLPLFHVAALISTMTATYNGNTLVVMRSFDPVKSWKILIDEKISTSFAVPAMLNFMLQVPDFENYDWSLMRWFMSGGAPLSVETIRAYKKVGIDVTQAFGMTEACGSVCMVTGEEGMRKAGSVGKPYFHTELRIVDEEGEDVAPGITGEIIVRSATVMKEYWNMPETTAEAIRDGWYHTGDVGIADEEGFVTIKDRIKDMIITGGENVYPAEIELLLVQHPEIVDAAVIGQKSEKWGESPFAVVVRKSESLSEADVLTHCESGLARFKLPKGVVFVDELPRNSTAKVLKTELRERYPGPAPE